MVLLVEMYDQWSNGPLNCGLY